ncbi:hypothetical protein [Nocardioides aequoreus]|uniref:hypothetical protein n=1 Tax=Nocardioides aequoreus TaxID=397278 RepID=UPI000691B282|nr:hypothetical protein [Nocardioides aequoreus]
MDDLNEELERIRLRTQSDVQRLWELLMRPLGFSSTTVWLCAVEEDGRPIPHLSQVGDPGDQRVPSSAQVAAFVDLLRRLSAEADEAIGFAVLLSRPGRSGLSDDDRRFAADLLRDCREAGVTCHPVHVADDVAVRAVTPDDLAA